MSNDDFDAPGSSSLLVYDDLLGRLLLIEPLSQEKAIPTEYGDNDAVRANVVVLDGPNAGEAFDDVLIFPRILQSQVRRNIGSGRKNLGRLGQGAKKPGKSAPWELGDPTDADKAIARAYLTQNVANAPF